MTNKALSQGRGWLRSDAASSVARIDAILGRPLDINSAGRSNAEQQALIKRWRAGGKYNRPPYLYQPAMYPPFPHATGLFIDTDDQAWMLKYGKAHGWRRTVPSDKPHFGYFPTLDLHRPGKAKDPNPDYQVYYCTDGHGKGWYYELGKHSWRRTKNKARRNYWIKKFGYGGTRTYAQILAIKASGKQA